MTAMLSNADSYYRKVFIALAAFSGAAMVLLSFNYGIIWDEWIQSQYGKLVLRFLLSGGTAQDCLTFGKTMYLYGGLFDTLTAAAYGFLFSSPHTVASYSYVQDLVLPYYFDTRHVINALFGFTGILLSGLLGKELRNWRTAVLSFLFVLLSPRFFGNSMNNPKDIPFATAYILSLYAMIRFFKSWPNPRLPNILLLATALAAAINIKSGGLMLVCYLLFFAGGLWAWSLTQKKTFPSPIRFLSYLIFITIASYLGGMLFWPYGLMDPLHHPLQALSEHSRFSGARGTLLFEGQLMFNDATPWYYLPKWILITVPLYIHAGLILFLLYSRRLIESLTAPYGLMLLFAILFPPFYAIAQHSIIYDSWRHFLFIFPPLAVMAALSWDGFLNSVSEKRVQIIALMALALMCLEPVCWMVRFHPHEYVYFNPLVGGLKGAYGRYETDYWGNSLRKGSEWLAQHYKDLKLQRPITVKSDGELISSAYYLVRDLGSAYVACPKGDPNWDYWLAISRGIEPEKLQSGQWPPPGTLHEIKADGVPLCAVIQNFSKS